MSMLKIEPKVYDDGRTKQSFKDETDINKILMKAQKVGSLSHLEKHGAFYGDFSDMPDLLEAHARMARGQSLFDELPSELRKEFDNDMSKFFVYVNDPENKDRLRELMPVLAEPGRVFAPPMRSARSEADPRMASSPVDEVAPVAPVAPVVAPAEPVVDPLPVG